MGRKAGSKPHKPADGHGAGLPGSKEKIIADIQRYINHPDDVMVSAALAGRLDATRNMDVSRNKLFEDGGHKLDVARFLGAKCAVTLPARTASEAFDYLESLLVFCTEQQVPPTIGMFAVWNGITQNRYNQIVNDRSDALRGDAFAACKEILRVILEQAAMENSVNPLVYFHQQKTQYDMVENQQVTVRVEDNSREIADEELQERMRLLAESRTVSMVELPDGTFTAVE